jgi:isoleucyl-tRNA synthetase
LPSGLFLFLRGGVVAGYRDTLNLPKTEFPMKADLTRREPERLQWWKERRLHEKLRAARAGAPVWLLHDGPPYSNNHLHMGTAANKIWKDAAVRVATLRGFDSPYVPGWDNHGMPIEIQVGRELRAEGVTADRLVLRRRCREYAAKWIDIQREEFERLGGWGDWEHPYLTMDPVFEAAILEAFAGLAEKGFVQRGQRSIHWCPTDRTALAEAEIEYQDDASPSVYVAFPLRRGTPALEKHPHVSAIAWTTTPWTLPANLGLMVDPAATYAVVSAGGATWLFAEPRLEAVRTAAGWDDATVVARVRGADLVGAVFEGPWGNDSRVVDGTPYVSMEDGTGLVHTAPGHGKEDFQVGQRSGLGVFCPVDEGGRFTAGAEPFVGRSVLDVNDDIIVWLRERNRVVAAGTMTHPYPHCWRCRQPVIFRATDQWFMIIDHAGHRDRALESIEHDVRWDPPASKNRIRESVRARPDWCLSRQRAWGVGIPAIYCDACGKARLDPEVMRRAAHITRSEGSDAWYEKPVESFLPPDYTCDACGAKGPFRKETDILDVWFDSGTTHRAARAMCPLLDAAWTRATAGQGAGADAVLGGARIVYFEGPDQHRGWFNSSLMVGVGLDGRAPYTDVLTHGWVLDAQGRAMHKSLGNVISPMDLLKKHGAEILRWWSLATDWRNDVRVGDEILQRNSEAYRKVRNTFRFLLGNLDDFRRANAVPDAELQQVDRAFARFIARRFATIREDWTDMRFHRALDGVLDLCTVHLSAVYLDVTKDRLYTLRPDDPARRSAQTVLEFALRELLLTAAPALVFTAEEAWQHHPDLLELSESVHLASWSPLETQADDTEWEFLIDVRNAVNAEIEPLRAAKTMATTAEAEVEIHASPAVANRLRAYGEELPAFLMVARAKVVDGAGDEIRVTARKTELGKCDRCWTYREDVKPRESGNLCSRCVTALDTIATRART